MPSPVEGREAGVLSLQQSGSLLKRGTNVSLNERGDTVVAAGSETGSAAANPRGLAPGPKMSIAPRADGAF